MPDEKDENKNPSPIKDAEAAPPGARETNGDAHHIDVSQSEIVTVGTGTTINYHSGVTEDSIKVLAAALQEGQKKLIGEILGKTIDKTIDSTVGALNKFDLLLKREREQVISANEEAAATASIQDVVELPVSDEKIEDWYYDLNDQERCFTEAVAILHGSPLLEISEAAGKLYQTTHAARPAPGEVALPVQRMHQQAQQERRARAVENC